MKDIIYLDNAATTKISKPVMNAMLPYLTEYYGNPSALYSLGRNNKKAINDAREKVANAIGAKSDEIYFTSGGSESNNMAIKGVCDKQIKEGKYKIITSNIEHPSVLNTCKYLETQGFEVTYIPVNKDGFVDPDMIADEIDNRTALISIMYANNEIGTIQPIEEIGDMCNGYGIPFHVDAVQAVGNIDIDLSKQNVDLMSISGHKINAPKGVGCLYIRNGIECSPLIHGGGQEHRMRAGTENVANIVGFGKAMELAKMNLNKKIKYVEYLRNFLMLSIVDDYYVKLNGAKDNRLCGNLNVSFKNCEGESIALQLANCGICVSARSACSSGNLEPSHVIKAIEDSEDYLYGSVRFSIGDLNTLKQIEATVEAVKQIVEFNKERMM
jgi:cysteine desulfurase